VCRTVSGKSDHLVENQGHYFIIPGTREWSDDDPRPQALRKIAEVLCVNRGNSPVVEREIAFPLEIKKNHCR
jgi:hypothetical protein